MKKRNWMYRLSSKSMSVMAALALMVTTMATNRSGAFCQDRKRKSHKQFSI